MPVNFLQIQNKNLAQNAPLLQEVAQGAQQVGQAFSGKTLKSMFQDVIDAGGSPITAMQKIMPYDPDLADRLGTSEQKKRGVETLKSMINQYMPELGGLIKEGDDPVAAFQTFKDLFDIKRQQAQDTRQSLQDALKMQMGYIGLANDAEKLRLQSNKPVNTHPFDQTLSGKQLKERFPNNAMVGRLSDNTVYPVRLDDNGLVSVGTAQPKVPSPGSTTPNERNRNKIMDDYKQYVAQMANILAGTGRTLAMQPEQIDKALSDIKRRMSVMEKQYVKYGGKIEDLGGTVDMTISALPPEVAESPGFIDKVKAFFGGGNNEAVDALTQAFPPDQFVGKQKVDNETGITYISDGKEWKPVGQ